MHIKVKPGFALRDPQTRTIIPPEGLAVPDDSAFYLRRLAEGSVEIVPDAPVQTSGRRAVSSTPDKE